VQLGPKTYCSPCSQRADVDYLEAFRQKYLGKRDGWAWFFGLSAIGNLIAAVASLFALTQEVQQGPSESLPFLFVAGLTGFSAVNSAAFWLGVPLARWGFLITAVASTALQIAAVGPIGAAWSIMPMAIAVNLFTNWRTRLFFQLPVTREVLQRAWDLQHNNTIARQSVIVATLGLVVPLIGIVAIVMGAVGLSRVDLKAYPPIGKRGYAIAGIALGVLSQLGHLVAYRYFSAAS
jgi:hypothetical protein